MLKAFPALLKPILPNFNEFDLIGRTVDKDDSAPSRWNS
jgi:hypothetical protein